MWKILLALVPLLVPSVQAEDWPTDDEMCLMACHDALHHISFGTEVSTDDYYTGYCQNTLLFQSAYLCGQIYCSPQEIERGLGYYQHTCDKVHVTIPSYKDTMANYSADAIKEVPKVGQHDKFEEAVNNTLVPDQQFYLNALKSNVDWYAVSKPNFYYAWALYGFWGLVLLIGMTNRLFTAVVQWRMRGIYIDSQSQPSNLRRRLYTRHFSGPRRWLQTNITLPAIFGYRHQQPLGWCTVPTRIQSLLVFVFVALNIIFCSASYRAFDGNIYFESRARQTWTYLADRTGVLAVGNLAFLWVFAARNDIFLWLTGWNFGTFNIFHRWIARVVTLQAIVHAIAFTVLVMLDGGAAAIAESAKEEYWYCGIIATTAFGLLMGFSAYPIRQRAYEIFFKFHISLAVFALVGVFYHIKIFDGKYEPYLWPCVAIWAFDYFVRLVRLIALNYKVAFGRHSKAVIKYNADRDIIRIYLTPSVPHQPREGTHYFLYFPTMLKTMGNHPFSVSGWTDPKSSSASSSVTNHAIDLEKVQHNPAVRATEAEVDSQTNTSENSTATGTELQFVIRPYKGLTAALRDKVIQTGRGSLELTVLVEGPYGHPHPVLTYDTVLFIVGGSGIAAALPYIHEFLHPRHNNRTRHIHLVWAVRQYSFARDILDTELAAGATASAHNRVKLDFFVTGPAPKALKHDALDLERFEDGDTAISYQRPVAADVIRDEVAQAVGSLAVLVCGPAQLADDARRGCVQAVKNGYDQLEYFEEQFGW